MCPMTLASPAFEEEAFIPRRYTCQGEDLSVPLNWSGVPPATRSLALTCVDPDAPRGDWVHWVLWDLPITTGGLSEGLPPEPVLPDGTRQGCNDFGRTGYSGPCPPPGHGPHRYYFTLYALDLPRLELGPPTGRRALEAAMQGHMLDRARTMGRYQR